MDTSTNKFSVKRVGKLVKLDLSANRGFILTMLFVSFIILILPILLRTAFFLDNNLSESFSEGLYISIFNNIVFVPTALSLLFGVIVYRRANKDCPMHISLIPATNKEKYCAFFIEWILKNLAFVLILGLTLTTLVIVEGGFSFLSQIRTTIVDIYRSFIEIMDYTGEGLWPLINTIAILYVVFMMVLSDFFLISMPTITFRKGWQVILFMAIFPIFLSTTISMSIGFFMFFVFDKMGITITDETSIGLLNTFLTSLLWGAIVLTTLFNVVMGAIGYKKLKTKSNRN